MMNETRIFWSWGNTLTTVAIAVSLTTVMVGAYWNILQTINAQQVAGASVEARLTVAERLIQTRQDNDDRFASEMRTAIHEIQNGVNALQVEEARHVTGSKR